MNQRRVWPEVRNSGIVLCGIVRRKLGRDMSRLVGHALGKFAWHPAWLERGRAIWPEEVVAGRYRPRPREVYDVFNELIEMSQRNGYSSVACGDVILQVMIRCRVGRAVIIDNGWLFVEHDYERRGFEVTFHRHLSLRNDVGRVGWQVDYQTHKGELEDLDSWTFVDVTKVRQAEQMPWI